MSRKPITFDSDAIQQQRQRQVGQALRLGLLLAVLAALLGVSAYFYFRLHAEETAARTRLRTFAELRTSTVERFFASLAQETALWANQKSLQDTARRYIESWRRLSPPERATVRRMLATTKQRQDDTMPFPHGDAVNAYLALHRETLENLRAFAHHHGYHNIYFFTPEGDMAFAVEKRDDFGLNFAMNGSIYAGSHLGQAFQRALRLISPGQAIFEDFSTYPPAGRRPVMFLAAPMLELEGEKIGVYVVEIGIERLNALFADDSGLGHSVSIYAIGPDMLFRNDLPNAAQPTALRRRSRMRFLKKALSGEEVVTRWRAPDGVEKVVVALPLKNDEINWAVVTEMALSEMRKPYRPYAWLWGASIVLILLLGGVQFWFLRRQ